MRWCRDTGILSRRPAIALAALALVCTAAGMLEGAAQHPDSALAATLPAGRPVTIAWGGDTTLGSSYGVPGDRGFAALRGVSRLLGAADLSAVNSEGTFGSGGTPKCSGGENCFTFQAPAANASALHRAGVDIANLANNHAFDFGASGMGQTVTALRHNHVQVTGRPGEIAILSVSGARVAFVGFSSYSWSASITDLAGVRALCRSASRRANIVVAFFHGGAEGSDRTHTPGGHESYLGEDRGDVRAFARAAIDGGADLVVGSGPHVLRGMERYHRRLIAYSLGNLAGYRNFATGGVLSRSGMLRATLASDGRLIGGRFESLLLDGDGIPRPDPSRASAGMVSDLSRADFGDRAVTVASDGTLAFPGAVATR